jgi:hypothetical protein
MYSVRNASLLRLFPASSLQPVPSHVLHLATPPPAAPRHRRAAAPHCHHLTITTRSPKTRRRRITRGDLRALPLPVWPSFPAAPRASARSAACPWRTCRRRRTFDVHCSPEKGDARIRIGNNGVRCVPGAAGWVTCGR